MDQICDKNIQLCDGLKINADSFSCDRNADISAEMTVNGGCILNSSGSGAVNVVVKGMMFGNEIMLMLENILASGQALSFQFCGMSFSAMQLKKYKCDIISGREAFCELFMIGTCEVTAVE